jgi:SNF2 family DNA or RNA helicase
MLFGAKNVSTAYFSIRANQIAKELCLACGEETPVGMLYCVRCGVDLDEAQHFREAREEQVETFVDTVSPKEWRTVLSNRRMASSVAAARALCVAEGLVGDDERAVHFQSLSELPFSPLDYQVKAAQRVLGDMHGRAILADEVGLGKTIEAGLVLKELVARKLCDNVLLLVPSSLLDQWQTELAEKFGLEVATHDTPRFWRKPLLLLSLTRAKQGTVARRLARRDFGLVIVDEAHALKNSRTVAHRFVRGLKAERLLLLTATPIENDLRELFNLLSLVDPAVYPTYRRFAREFLVSRYRVKDVRKLRQFCATYMIRNRRTTAFPEMPPRLPRLIRCAAHEREMDFLNRTLTFVRRVYGRSAAQAGMRGEQHRSAAMLFLTLLLKESCSSPDAVIATVGQTMLPRLEESDGAILKEILAAGRRMPPTGKMRAFVKEVVKIQPEAAVAYVEFFATHTRLSALLKKKGVPVIPYTGRMTAADKQERILQFRRDGGLLLCTEVGGQGLNLQHCSTVINYDVPWNPMRLEQRIGRVHRYGQDQPINVVHFVTEGTYEEHVLELLTRKLELFTQAIGELEAILSFVEEEESLTQMVARAICTAEDPDALSENFRSISERLSQAATRYQRSRAATSRLLDEEEP